MNISFVMPAYNYANYIGQAIASIMSSNFEDGDELVVCDDSSTDGTVEEIRRLQQKWPQIQLVAHAKNRGGGAARNTAIRHSHNPLIFCLDADNVLEPDSIAPLKRFLIDSEADGAAFKGMRYFSSGPELIQWPMDTVTIEHYLCGESVPGMSGNYMYTRESWGSVGGYPENTWLDTWGFGLKQAAHREKIVVMPRGQYFHRRGHHSYYMRGLERSTPSRAALPVLREFFHLLHEDDVEYAKNSDDWYDNLKQRPLRLK